MRDTVRYPVTKDEILECLDNMLNDLSYTKTGLVGDMRPLLISKAKDIILMGKFDQR
jgi:hypothetical protein